MLTIAGWRVDADAHQISDGATVRRLEPRVMEVLLVLAERAGSVVTRTELMNQVWGDTFITDDAVSAAVIKLRKAFGDDARRPRVIETVPKSGYRLIATVGEGVGPAVGASDAPERTIRNATVLRCRLDVDQTQGTAAEAWERAVTACRSAAERLIAADRRTATVLSEPAAVVLVFGAPRASEHHALRAVSTARALVAADLPVTPSIGIATGDVIASASTTDGSISSVFGEPIALATTLAVVARPGDILVGPVTGDLVDDRIATEPLPAEFGVTAYRVIGDRPDAAQRRSVRDTVPLVGRVAERALLDDSLRSAVDGHGGAVVISAPAGVGKTRLLRELESAAQDRGLRRWLGAASPLDRHTPYVPLRACLSAAAQAQDADLEDRVALAALLNPEDAGEVWATLDATERTARVTTVVEDLLLPDDQPTLIAVEDLHWADDATRALLSALAARIRRHRCLLVVTTRPDESDSDLLNLSGRATSVSLRPLPPDDAATLLQSYVGDDDSLTTWRAEVLQRTAGTPLYLRESVASAVAAGALLGAPGSYALDPSIALNPVPTSLRGLLTERIDALPARARVVVEAAATIGPESDATLLFEVVDFDDTTIGAALSELDDAGILEPAGTRSRPTYAFTHALLREAAALGLPSDRRRALHARIGAALEARSQTDRDARPETLAHHWTEAGDAERAIPCWLEAARVAGVRGAYDDALTQLEAAEALLEHLDAVDERKRHEVAISLARGAALVQTVGPTDDAVLHSYEQADRLVRGTPVSTEQFQAVWGRWLVHMMRGNVTELPPLADEVFALATDLGDQALLLEAHHVQWSGLILAGRPAEARAHTEVVIAQYDPAQHHWLTYSYGGHDPGVCALNLNAMTCWLAGDDGTAIENSRRARELADTLDHGYTLLESMQSALTIALVERHPDDLDVLTARLLDLVDGSRLPPLTAGFVDGFRGAASAYRGDLTTAASLMRAAAPIWREFWGAWCHPIDVAYAEVLAQTGAAAEARDHLERVLAEARSTGAVWWEDRLLAALQALD